MRRGSSIRARLLWRLAPVVAFCCLLAAGFVYFGTRAELRDALNAQSDVLALTIAGLSGDTIPQASFHEELARYAGDYVIRVWDANGGLLVDSSAAFAQLGERGGATPLKLGPGWDSREYLLASGEKIVIARLTEEAEELVLQLALSSLLPLAVALIFSILTAAFLVRQGLRPLTALSRELTRRSATDLGQLPQRATADELQPIVDELNSLFARIQRFLARERRFVDDAAHELRTPLSVIKAQCQAIDPTALTPEAQQRLDHIVTGVDRMAALTAQLLDQARAEQDAGAKEPIAITALLRAVLADLTPQAERAGTVLNFVDAASPTMLCHGEDLRMILRNILENALKFAKAPGQVQITLRADHVVIEDNGPGIPKDIRALVFDRFYQQDKTPTAGNRGAGLGLSIVASLAKRNGLAVTVDQSDTLGGAAFYIRWGDQGDG